MPQPPRLDRPLSTKPAVTPRAREDLKLVVVNLPHHSTDTPIAVPMFELQPNTAYEELIQIGYRADLKRLEAVVELRESDGDGNDLGCGTSNEYVRFYVSVDGGTTFRDRGLGCLELDGSPRSQTTEHVVAIPFDAAPFVHTVQADLLRVRAILSWGTPPPANRPNYAPFWGNVLDAFIHPTTVRLVVPRPPGGPAASDSGVLRIVRRGERRTGTLTRIG